MAVTHSTRPLRGLARFRPGGALDGDECGDVENPEEAVVDEEGVLVEIVEGDEEEYGKRPGDAIDGAVLPEGPECEPATQPAEKEEKETGGAKLESDFEEAVVGVGNDEVDGGGDLKGGALHAAPEGVVAVAAEGTQEDEVRDLCPDGGASGEASEANAGRREGPDELVLYVPLRAPG